MTSRHSLPEKRGWTAAACAGGGIDVRVRLHLLDDFAESPGRTHQAASVWASPEYLEKLEGQFALIDISGSSDKASLVVARTLAEPLRYLVFDVPTTREVHVLVARRIDTLKTAHDRLAHDTGTVSYFDPAYTRMPPAHYLVRVALVPGNVSTYDRFFLRAGHDLLPPDVKAIAACYAEALYREVLRELERVPYDECVGIALSGGIDSGSVMLCLVKAFQDTGRDLSRLRAFTLSVDGHGTDVANARKLVDQLRASVPDFKGVWHVVDISAAELGSLEDAIALLEDYKPADLEVARVALPFFERIRRLEPGLRFLFDGDGADENLLSYPLRDPRYPAIDFNEAIGNPLLFTEGRAPDNRHFSVVYSAGLSRSYVRTFNPAARFGFKGISPYTGRAVIGVAAAIPFGELAHTAAQLAGLKARIVPSGVKAITGHDLPANPKTRMQDGCATQQVVSERIGVRDKGSCKRLLMETYLRES